MEASVASGLASAERASRGAVAGVPSSQPRTTPSGPRAAGSGRRGARSMDLSASTSASGAGLVSPTPPRPQRTRRNVPTPFTPPTTRSKRKKAAPRDLGYESPSEAPPPKRQKGATRAVGKVKAKKSNGGAGSPTGRSAKRGRQSSPGDDWEGNGYRARVSCLLSILSVVHQPPSCCGVDGGGLGLALCVRCCASRSAVLLLELTTSLSRGLVRTQVKNACARCRRNKTRCDDKRPCGRCVRLGFGKACVDAVHKVPRRGRDQQNDTSMVSWSRGTRCAIVWCGVCVFLWCMCVLCCVCVAFRCLTGLRIWTS